MRKMQTAMALTLLGVIVGFTLLNTEPVTYDFLVAEKSISRAIPVLLAYVLGALTAEPLLTIIMWRARGKKKKD